MTPWNLIVTIALALALACSHLLDEPADHSAEWTEADELQLIQQQEAEADRRELAAHQLCAEQAGPNAGHRWTADGQLVCTDKRGRAARRTPRNTITTLVQVTP